MNTLIRYFLASFALLGTHVAANAQTGKGFFETYLLEITLGLALAVSIVVLLLLVVVLYMLQAFVKAQQKAKAEAAGLVYVEQPEHSLFGAFWQRLSGTTPIEQEADLLTDHEYDGIRELDNNLPPWWKYLFYLTIVFAVGYLGYYHVLGMGKLQDAEYQAEMDAAARKVAEAPATPDMQVDETNVVALAEEGAVTEGKKLFIQYCAACHANDGGGSIGPNLTDEYWIHGGDVKAIFKTIKYGVPQKGMISWEKQLAPLQIQQLASFVLTLQGTRPTAPKDPEGDLYVPEVVTTADSTANP